MTQKITEKTVEIQHLFFSREDSYLFIDFSLQILAGEWIALRGNNGIGKSTLLKLIARQIPPESGEIWTIPFSFLGHKNGQRSTRTVLQQLRSKRDLVRSTVNINDIIEACNLVPIKDFIIGKLSAGQQRKIALAELFFTPEKLWLLDEPLNHLDTTSQKVFEDLFRRHVQLGGTIVQSAHSSYPNSSGVQEIWLGTPPQE